MSFFFQCLYVAKEQSRKMKIEIHNTWGIRLAGACVAPGRVCWSPNDVLRGVESPHFSSIQPVLFSICITSVCVHYHLIKLQSYWQTQAQQPLLFFHCLMWQRLWFPWFTVKLVLFRLCNSGPQFCKSTGKKWQERQEVAVCVCLDLCLSAVSVF